MNETFAAWNALHEYLRASAVRGSHHLTGTSRNPSSSVMVSATGLCWVPTTVNGGAKKSATPEPSRRNSGHIAVPKLEPRLSEHVDENRVHEIVDGPGRDGAADHHAVKRGSGTSGAECLGDLLDGPLHVEQSVLPFGADGVPTHTRET